MGDNTEEYIQNTKVPKRKRRPWALTKLLSKPTCLHFGQTPFPAKSEEKVPLIQHIFPFYTAALAQDSTWESDLPNNVKQNTCRLLACTKWEWKPTKTKAQHTDHAAQTYHSSSSLLTHPAPDIQAVLTDSGAHSKLRVSWPYPPHSGRLYAWCSTSPWNFAHVSFLPQKFNFIISISWPENKWGNRVALAS